MNKFQIGDRVECHYGSGDWDGELGTVVYVQENGRGSIAVELDSYDESKHTCDGGQRLATAGGTRLPNSF